MKLNGKIFNYLFDILLNSFIIENYKFNVILKCLIHLKIIYFYLNINIVLKMLRKKGKNDIKQFAYKD